jgi:hypothetical protein
MPQGLSRDAIRRLLFAICENREKSGKTGQIVGFLKLQKTRENSESVTGKKSANEPAGNGHPAKSDKAPKKPKLLKVGRSSPRSRAFRIAQAEQTDRRQKAWLITLE